MAVTVYYLLSAVLIIFIGNAFERFGRRRVVLLGSAAMGAGMAGRTVITESGQRYAAFLVMGVG